MITTFSSLLRTGTICLLLPLAAACGPTPKGADGGMVTPAPTILSMTPANGATGVALNESVSVVFSEAMAPGTLTAATFTLTLGTAAIPIVGTVIASESTAVFWPAAHLSTNVAYNATITTGVTSAAGVALAASQSWTFTTGTTLAPGLTVNLGTAGSYAILAKSGVSTVPTSIVTGDVGVSPAAATYLTGFSMTMDSTNVFASSAQVTGKLYAANYAPPTPVNMTTAVSNMMTAFADAASRAPDATELGAGNIGGMTLAPGVYRWSTGLLIPTNVTLAGGPTGVWIFQVAQDLTVSSAANVVLSGGALPANVFWQVSGLVNIGTTAKLAGVVMAQTSVTLQTGATVDGRLFAQTAVSIDSSTVTQPSD